jgi:hypothetical protein
MYITLSYITFSIKARLYTASTVYAIKQPGSTIVAIVAEDFFMALFAELVILESRVLSLFVNWVFSITKVADP